LICAISLALLAELAMNNAPPKIPVLDSTRHGCDSVQLPQLAGVQPLPEGSQPLVTQLAGPDPAGAMQLNPQTVASPFEPPPLIRSMYT
jgi:hypothetical protein